VARRPSRLALSENRVSGVPRRTSCRLLLSVKPLGGPNTPALKRLSFVELHSQSLDACCSHRIVRKSMRVQTRRRELAAEQ